MVRTDLVLAVLLAGVTAASRIPFRARLLASWDAVQFALALREYDIVKHQPHPPGYILYVGAARALEAWLGDPAASLGWLSIGASAAAVFCLYWLGWLLYGRATALAAGVTLAVSPLFWLYGEVALPYAVESALATAVALLVWPMRAGRTPFVVWSALALGVAGGVRQSLLLVLGPLWLGMAWAGLRRWRPVLGGVVLIALVSAAWFVPMVYLAGGLERYAWVSRELYESTVRATTILAPGGEWRGNVRALGEALLMSLGLLLPGLAWALGRRLVGIRAWGAREWFLAAWIVPPLAVYTTVHFGQYGYLLTVLPALCLLIARTLVEWAGEAGGTGARRRAGLAVAALAAVVVAHAGYFIRAEAIEVPAIAPEASSWERQRVAWRAFYRYRLWSHTARGLRETEQVIEAYAGAIRREFDPTRTVVVTELGNPRAYPWFRHATYYLPEFAVVHLRLGRFSPGYLSSARLESMAARVGPDVPLPPSTRQLVWMVDYWNPGLPRPAGLREVLLPHGRWLYVLDVDRAPVEHGAYRFTPATAVARADAPGCAANGAAARDGAVNVPTFHGDPGRRGWNDREPVLTPRQVASPAFGPLWSSPPLDAVTLDGRTHPARLYASPLYVDRVEVTGGAQAGKWLGLVVAASSNGWVYAIQAGSDCAEGPVPPGAIVWRTRLVTPGVAAALDGGVPVGILGTPTIDLKAVPPRLYVAAMDAVVGWQVFALELGSGRVLPGWPLAIHDAALGPANANGPARFGAPTEMSQRAALATSPRGEVLYVAFGTYAGTGPGWMVAIDTRGPRHLRAFASAPVAGVPPTAGCGAPGVRRWTERGVST